jgi:hypothetical protein
MRQLFRASQDGRSRIARLSGVLIALATLGSAAAEARPALRTGLSGTYAGTYQCSGGLIGATLKLTVNGSKASGALAFYPLLVNPQAPSGSFRMTGGVSDGQLTLRPGDWIEQPSSPYGAAGIEAGITPYRIAGRPVGPESWDCTAIRLERLPELP